MPPLCTMKNPHLSGLLLPNPQTWLNQTEIWALCSCLRARRQTLERQNWRRSFSVDTRPSSGRPLMDCRHPFSINHHLCCLVAAESLMTTAGTWVWKSNVFIYFFKSVKCHHKSHSSKITSCRIMVRDDGTVRCPIRDKHALKECGSLLIVICKSKKLFLRGIKSTICVEVKNDVQIIFHCFTFSCFKMLLKVTHGSASRDWLLLPARWKRMEIVLIAWFQDVLFNIFRVTKCTLTDV